MSYTKVWPLGHSLTMKDAGLRISLQRGIRDQFPEMLKAQDKPATQLQREFMGDYISKHQPVIPEPGLTENTDPCKTGNLDENEFSQKQRRSREHATRYPHFADGG